MISLPLLRVNCYPFSNAVISNPICVCILRWDPLGLLLPPHSPEFCPKISRHVQIFVPDMLKFSDFAEFGNFLTLYFVSIARNFCKTPYHFHPLGCYRILASKFRACTNSCSQHVQIFRFCRFREFCKTLFSFLYVGYVTKGMFYVAIIYSQTVAIYLSKQNAFWE